MITVLDVLNISMAAAGVAIAVLALLAVYISRNVEKDMQYLFIQLFTVVFIYTASNLASNLTMYSPELVFWSKLFLFLGSASSALLIPISVFLLTVRAGEKSGMVEFYVVEALCAVYLGILIFTQFTEYIYYYTPDGVYHRGPAYFILLVPTAIAMLVSIIALYRRRKMLALRERVAFSVYFTAPLAAMLVQMNFYGVQIIVIATVFSAALLFELLMSEQARRFARRQEENARQRASILVLEMRPHFISNTLMSIYYLVGMDPERAKQVILDFTSYLRRNFTAIAREGTVSFAEELEHTRAYLAVEQVRFEGRLFVEMDTPHTSFVLPPLTLQPIVENAVKHGVDPELKPLTITIRTRKTKTGSEITVENDGPDFTPADGDHPHVALRNIRERLELMCSGKLEITDRPGGGTSVKITLPEA